MFRRQRSTPPASAPTARLCATFGSRLRKLATAEGGAAAMYFALSAPMWIGGMGLGLEVGTWYFYQQSLQSHADAVADSIAARAGVGASRSELDVLANSVLTRNGFDFGRGTFTYTITPEPSEDVFNDGTTVTANLTRTVPRYLTGIFEQGEFVISARASAEVRRATHGCILALSQNTADTLQVNSLWGMSTDIKVPGCEVLSNSLWGRFIVALGAALTTDCARSAGNIITRGSLSMTVCPGLPREQAGVTLDPYGDRPGPDLTALTKCHYDGVDYIWRIGAPTPYPRYDPVPGEPAPSRYVKFCNGARFVLRKSGSLMPDVLYILDEAQLVVEDGFDVTAPSSTFYFTNGGSVTFLGPNTTFKATAPLVGPRAGMLFWGAQDAALAQRIEVGTGSALSGAIYFPGSHLDFRGTDTLSGCTQILADRVILTGRWTGAGPCTIPGTSPIVASRRVRLIE